MAKEKDDSSKKKKIKGFKEFDPSQYIELEPVIAEAVRGDTAVVSWGRMNPITTGHEKLINAVMNIAKTEKASPSIFLTHSQDNNKNPLSYEDKIKYAQKAFGSIITKSKAKTIIELMKEMARLYKNIIVVVGSDRVKEFETLLNKYNGKEYKFNNIQIISAGERDPDAEGVSGMSASKMREYASSNDLNNFTKGLPKKLKSSAEQIMSDVRKGMNEESINEEEDLHEKEPRSIAHRRALRMLLKRIKTRIKIGRERAKRKMASKEKLQKRARRKALEFIRDRLSKQKKYKDMTPSEKIALDRRVSKINPRTLDRIALRLFPKVRAAEKERLAKALSQKKENANEMFESFLLERDTTSSKPQDPDVKDRPGSQPKGYYKGVAKDKKDARAAHFERGAKMDDDNPAAYKPAPGDKEAKTKPSVHTKKFKDMFGEMNEAYKADMTARKRPHMALEKNGSVKIDKRFKIFKPKDIQEANESELEDIIRLMEETEVLIESNAKAALQAKAEKSGMPYSVLKQVYDRGVAAWRTGHRPGTNPHQWGLARVNSFATKSSGTWGKADKDLADKVRKEETQLDEAPRRKGAPKMTGDSIAIQRAKDAEHAKAMGRSVKTGRKLPKKTMTSTQRSLASLRGEENEQMPKTYKNIIEAATPQMKKAAASIEAYAKKSGGIDKADFMKAAKMLSSGNAGSNFIKFVDDLDTEPREWLITNLAKTMGKQTVEKMFKVKIREEVELDETLSPSEKKLVNQMYDKKGNLTAIGKKVMNHGKKPGDKGYVESNAMAAPKIDDKKYSEYMASRQKPMRQSSTKKSLADIRKKAEIYKKEEINLSKKEEIFEANEQTLNTLLEKIHNHVLNGEDYKTVINEITTIGNFGWSSRELTELYVEKYVDINEEINSSLAALYEKHVNEGELTDIAKERIAREKQRDKIKHLQMIARAKVKDLKKEDTPSDREWGTDSLTAKYKKDTPGQND